MSSTQDLMGLISRMEGWGISNSVATRNNNPGNLKYAGQAGAIDKDSRGYAIFGSPESGWAALQRQIELDASREFSVREFIGKYAPSSENNTSGYLSFVTEGLGIGADEKLSSITGGSGVIDVTLTSEPDTNFDLSYNRDGESESGSGVVVLLGAAVLGIILYDG